MGEPQPQERISARQEAEDSSHENLEPPRDYVPKAEGEPGTLSEDYSVKR